MEIQRYGVTLRRLREEDLAQVMEWRNQAHVRENMEHQEEISEDGHLTWYRMLDPRKDLYFVISSGDLVAGVINVKEIDWMARRGEAGIFIGEEAFLGTFLPVQAVLALMDCSFELWGFQALEAKMRGDNPAVVSFNQNLGYQPGFGMESAPFIRMECLKENYFFTTANLCRKAEKAHSGPPRLILAKGEEWILDYCRKGNWEIIQE